MIHFKQVIDGIFYLRRIQNQDGGIPATKPGAVSGCWTSGETLEALIASPYQRADLKPFALRLVKFLKDSQLQAGEHKGGWPLVVGGKRSSTMATGHVVAAFLLTQSFFSEDSDLKESLSPLIATGFRWLDRSKNDDGGWGVEPSGGPDGSLSRMISTTYALRAYFEDNKTVENSRTVRDSIEWIKSLFNADDGAGGFVGDSSDPCNTARAITALIRSRSCKPTDPLIRNAIKYINHARPHDDLWALDTETYVTEGAPGQTVYNSNTTADVLEAFIRSQTPTKATRDLVNWFLLHQNDDGSWELGANKNFVRDITTWSTNEALLVLSLDAILRADKPISELKKQKQLLQRVLIAVGLIALTELIFLVNFPEGVISIWNGIPDSWQDILISGVILALLINFISALIYDYLPWRRSNHK